MSVRMMTREEAKTAGIEIPAPLEYECSLGQSAPFTMVSKALTCSGACGAGYFVQGHCWNMYQINLYRYRPSAIAIAPAGLTRADLDNLTAN